MKKFFLFIFLSSFLFAEEIKLPEEKIVGESKEIIKTKIFIFSPQTEEITFPEIEMPEIKIPEKEVKKEKKEEIKEEIINKNKENSIFISGGSFYTTDFNFSHKGNNISFEIYNNYTEGFRENDEEYSSGINFYKKEEKYLVDINLKGGKKELTGPLFFPFNIDRNWLNLQSGLTFFPDEKTSISIFQNYYKIDDLKTCFSFLEIKNDFDYFSSIFSFNRQDFFHNFSQNSFSEGVYSDIGNTKIGGKIKVIENSGVRFVPYFKSPLIGGLNFEINGIYRIPDLWEDVINHTWAEIKQEELEPEEGYWVDLGYENENDRWQLKTGGKYTVWRNFYTWSDVDNNFLFQPFPEKFNQFTLYLNHSFSLTDNIKYFLECEKAIRSKDINYFPENSVNSGVILTYLPFILKLWTQYNGKRASDGEQLDNFVVLNCDIKYKKGNYQFGVKVENITDKKFFDVRGYPGERRKTLFYFEYYF